MCNTSKPNDIVIVKKMKNKRLIIRILTTFLGITIMFSSCDNTKNEKKGL